MSHRIIFLFIDGIGLGVAGPANPFSRVTLPGFEALSGEQPWDSRCRPFIDDDACFCGIDATLGVDGLPQSGTGQASLFTGQNCAAIVGRHFGPFPHSATRETIRLKNIFQRFKDLGKEAAFTNAYPPVFFEESRKRDRWSVTTRSCLDSNTMIRTLDHLDRGEALAADITGERLRKRLDSTVRVLDEVEASENLVSIALRNELTVFEYFHTDKAGHARSEEQAIRCLRSLDKFLLGLLRSISGTGITVILTSDHGNVEDLSVKTHTRNPVPFAAYGPLASIFRNISSIQDVTPLILSAMK